MTLMLIWGFIALLSGAVGFLLWFQFAHKTDITANDQVFQLEQKVQHLEQHLKASLEIMQDLAKKMHIQQEVLDKTVGNISALEKQNAELVKVLEIVVKGGKLT